MRRVPRSVLASFARVLAQAGRVATCVCKPDCSFRGGGRDLIFLAFLANRYRTALRACRTVGEASFGATGWGEAGLAIAGDDPAFFGFPVTDRIDIAAVSFYRGCPRLSPDHLQPVCARRRPRGHLWGVSLGHGGRWFSRDFGGGGRSRARGQHANPEQQDDFPHLKAP